MATIFLATSFDTVNRLRAEVVTSILRGREHEVLVGDDLDGDRISSAVQQRIEFSDGLIAIFPRRDQLQEGAWSTHPWVIEEATWAQAKGKRVLRVVEDGVTRLGGIAGDVEEVRFPTGQFEICIPKLLSFSDSVAKLALHSPVIQAVERRQTFSIVPYEPIEEPWSQEIKRLIEETRSKAELQLFQEALELSTRAVQIEPLCWRAHINRGVALVHLGRYKDAESIFNFVTMNFSSSSTVVARALHNKGWLIGMRDGLGNTATLRVRKELYMQALALDNRRIFTRAILLICIVLLGEEENARPFLEASLK